MNKKIKVLLIISIIFAIAILISNILIKRYTQESLPPREEPAPVQETREREELQTQEEEIDNESESPIPAGTPLLN